PHQKSTSRRLSEPAWTVRRQVSQPPVPVAPAAPRARITRRFEAEWLQDGQVESSVTVAPALPIFEQAFSAFTHGVLIQTTEGPVAVEDLCPGMYLECGNGRATQLLWKGSITLVPGAPSLNDGPDHLYRVMPDAFGLGRPLQDQTFGPHARRLDRDPKLRAAMGTDAALVPLSAMADWTSVIEVTPVSPTRVYHLACEGHENILAAGLEVESFHPGPETPLSLPEEMLQVFMQFFPYLSSVRAFGRLGMPRLTADEFARLMD
ncbi:MAG: Hint domain-containing protein, partial [Alphaproteobacteria bacterium]|nr:Hint domain-containing protein [Alphaproteobacteria bacterium]